MILQCHLKNNNKITTIPTTLKRDPKKYIYIFLSFFLIFKHDQAWIFAQYFCIKLKIVTLWFISKLAGLVRSSYGENKQEIYFQKQSHKKWAVTPALYCVCKLATVCSCLYYSKTSLVTCQLLYLKTAMPPQEISAPWLCKCLVIK